MIGQNVRMLMPPPFREEHNQYLKNYKDTGERKIIGIGCEVVGTRKDTTTFPMELSVSEAKQVSGSAWCTGSSNNRTDTS
jgi:two-component system sensor kinase FixL